MSARWREENNRGRNFGSEHQADDHAVKAKSNLLRTSDKTFSVFQLELMISDEDRFGPTAQYFQHFNILLKLNKMPKYFIICVAFGILFPLLLAAGAVQCSGRESPLIPSPRPIARIAAELKLTDCLMECSQMTYIKKVQLQDRHNIRLQDSTDGGDGEYCWSTELQCNVGERYQKAFVVLPVDVNTQLEVKVTTPTATTLHVHVNPTTIAESCGLRYDVTEYFSSGNSHTSFCVEVVNKEDVPGDGALRCPPHLVTFWQRRPNQSNQQGDG